MMALYQAELHPETAEEVGFEPTTSFAIAMFPHVPTEKDGVRYTKALSH